MTGWDLTTEYDPSQLQLALNEGWKQTVLDLACQAIPEAKRPEALHKHLMQNAAKNLRLEYGHALIHKVLTDAGIDYLIIKGCVSAQYYKDPNLRVMGDVDFLVRPEDLEKTRRLLADQGFREDIANNDHHITLISGGVTYELHQEVPGIPNGTAGQNTRALLADIWEKSRVMRCSAGVYRAPSDFHHGLIVLLHNCHHWVTGGIGLRHLCDWAVFLNQAEDFENQFRKPLESIGLWEFTKQMSDLCSAFLGCSRQAWMGGTEEAQLQAMIEDVFSSGNFGHKNPNSNYEAKFLSDNGKTEIGRKGFLRQFASSVSVAVCRDWPKASRFFPARWGLCLYFVMRESVRMLLGKRPAVRVGTLMQKTKERRKLYEEFRLFEVNQDSDSKA